MIFYLDYILKNSYGRKIKKLEIIILNKKRLIDVSDFYN